MIPKLFFWCVQVLPSRGGGFFTGWAASGVCVPAAEVLGLHLNLRFQLATGIIIELNE